MILIDHDHRHEALPRVRQGDRHRSGIEVVHTQRVKRVAVLALDVLVLDRRQPAEVLELTERTLLHEAGKGSCLSRRE